jgi:hypothetical protein
VQQLPVGRLKNRFPHEYLVQIKRQSERRHGVIAKRCLSSSHRQQLANRRQECRFGYGLAHDHPTGKRGGKSLVV